MKKIAMIGHSPACWRAIERIREAQPDTAVSLISSQGARPYRRRGFADFIAGRKSLKEIYVMAESEFHKLGIEYLEKKISRINFSRRRIFFEDKQTLDFDILLIADTEDPKWPDIKGTGKMGVFCPDLFTDIQAVSEHLILTETVVLAGRGIEMLRMACALGQRKKEVIWIVPDTRVLSQYLDEESSSVIREGLDKQGVRMIPDNGLTEILGNGDVKAVRLRTGKVIAAQMVIFGEIKPDLKLFRDTELEVNQGIAVNPDFQTNFTNVYAVANAAQQDGLMQDGDFDSYQNFLEQQGDIIAASILGGGKSLMPPLPFCEILMGQETLQLIGNTRGDAGIIGQAVRDDRIFKKMFLDDGTLIGAVLLNCPQDKEKIFKEISAGWDAQMPKSVLKDVSRGS